ncbi:CBS domain-containing protein [Candidatus Bathyarchaeota archaeon]|nr:CBS domain-containing protein [Candidatus Bathyarchaeota archaeon]
MSLKIGEIMIKDVVKIDGNVTVEEVAMMMNEHEIGCVIIVQDENPIGIITERDMLKRVLLELKDPKTTKAFQIMSAPLFFGHPRMTIQDAVKRMTEKKIKKLPIIDEGRLVGMITLTDLARSVAYLEHIFSKMQNNAK